MTGAAVEELQRIGLKLFTMDGTSVLPREFVPIFHRWIQTQAVPDQVLVDVADYSHVPDGPGVMLVAHEGNFSIDLGGGRMGLAYNRKTPAKGLLADRLRSLTHTVLAACKRIEDEPSLAGRIHFRGDELEVFANDRLLAPNTPATLAAFRPALAQLTRTLYADTACKVTPQTDSRERFGVHVKTSAGLNTGDLLARFE